MHACVSLGVLFRGQLHPRVCACVRVYFFWEELHARVCVHVCAYIVWRTSACVCGWAWCVTTACAAFKCVYIGWDNTS